MSINWDDILKTIGSTAVVVGVAAFVLKSLFAQFLARKLKDHEAALKLASDRELERLKAGVAAGAAREERVRQEIERWANPIAGAVGDLKARLHNIQSRDGYAGLSRDGTKLPVGWKIGYDYFLPSTVFIFAQYFCWIRFLQESLTFELFPQAEKDEFLEKVRRVGHPLSTWPLTGPPSGAVKEDDAQIFSLQQRQIGDSMIVADAAGERCMRAGTFFERWSDAAFRAKFQSLVTFLDGLTPDHALRWERLKRMDAALKELAELCQRILAPPAGSRLNAS